MVDEAREMRSDDAGEDATPVVSVAPPARGQESWEEQLAAERDLEGTARAARASRDCGSCSGRIKELKGPTMDLMEWTKEQASERDSASNHIFRTEGFGNGLSHTSIAKVPSRALPMVGFHFSNMTRLMLCDGIFSVRIP